VQWGSQTINDGSGNSVDFGTVGNDSGVRTQTFRVVNNGDATLVLGKVKLPAGYKVTEGVSGKIKPGASDTFTVSLDGTAGAGTHAGRISIASNDPDEKGFDFAVTGRVIGVSGSVDKSGSLILNGTAGADVIAITGTGSKVKVTANGNSQTFNGVKRIYINAGDGNDKVSVGTSIAASISGGNGNDTLAGGKGGDTLTGDGGDDRLTGGLGSDWLVGGDGKDVLNAQDGIADRKVDGGSGVDKITADPTDSKTGT
jgi:Ca2+-binding RTX toxin-like protein